MVNARPENFSMAVDFVESFVAKAVALADERGVSGKGLTPFLLSEIEKETGGKSVETNVALGLNNIQLGARLAAALKPV